MIYRRCNKATLHFVHSKMKYVVNYMRHIEYSAEVFDRVYNHVAEYLY